MKCISTSDHAQPKQRPSRLAWAGLVALVGLLAFVGWWLTNGKPRAQKMSDEGMTATSSAQPADTVLFAAYAGSDSCRDCHKEAYERWKNSNHALAERAVDATLDRSAFDPPRTFKHGSQSSEARIAGERLEIVTTGLGGERKVFPVERVIGVHPLRQFLIAAPGGRYQVTELATDPVRGDWFDVFGEEDRQPGEWGHWTGRGMNWNTMCAACHNTRVLKSYEPATDTFNTHMAERGVGCEACHGPMAEHVTWQRKLGSSRREEAHSDLKSQISNLKSQNQILLSSPAPKDPTIRRLDKDQMLTVCGSCHARRAELTSDFKPGDHFFDHFLLTIPDETDVFYPDGQVREEDYEFTSFLGSRMHAAGVRCGDCHEPHSAKLSLKGNDLCLRCHSPPLQPAPKIEPVAHSHHAADSTGNRCVECHMPTTVYMQRHARHDHGFTIPDPLLTKQHGIPNACNRCHADRSVDWAIEAAEKWYGARMARPSRARAQVIAQARDGNRATVEQLVKLAREEKISLWRAVATGFLRHWPQEPTVVRALAERAADPDPLVRSLAARALDPLAALPDEPVQSTLRRLREDPVRAVRIEAAWAARAKLDTNSVAGRDLWGYLRHNADLPSALLQAGVFHSDRGQNEAALAFFQRAVSWDGGSAPLRHALALALSAQGKPDDAVRELEAACRLAPRDAEYRFQLGLALNEAGRLRGAIAALEEATKLDLQFAKAWYNLGLAYSAQEQPERALEALVRAESVDATSAQIPYARATILVRLGRLDEARVAARRALELEPSFADAAALLRALAAEDK
ncbi:MAG: tetratricopeptide repeat protein [Verrucomicrobia bacterium]|nr:tetratricopeptide repeat protein [Verrucomicrobiota bacterium]